MAGTVIADRLEAASTSQLVIKNGVASTPPTIQDSAGTTIGTFCRAWVNFNGTSTVAIRASFNVSSITDNATGDYTVNFTTALTDANYSYNCSGSHTGTTFYNVIFALNTAVLAGSLRLNSVTQSGGAPIAYDPTYVSVSIFR
jgi:hypothetical protein